MNVLWQYIIVGLIVGASVGYVARRWYRRRRRNTRNNCSEKAYGCSDCEADCPLRRPNSDNGVNVS